MRSLSILLQLALAALVVPIVTAKPQPFYFDWQQDRTAQVNPSSDTDIEGGGFFKDFGEVAQGFANHIDETHRRDVEIKRNFGENVRQATQEFTNEARQYAQTVAQNVGQLFQETVKNFLASFKDFISTLQKQVQEQSNSSKRRALQNIQTTIDTINTRFNALNDSVQGLAQLWDNNVVTEQNKILGDWQEFAKAQLEMVSSKTNNDQDIRDRADNILKEYVKSYETDLSSCTKELEQSVQEYERAAQETLLSYQPTISQLIEEVAACIKSEDSFAAAIECTRNTKDSRSALRRAATTLKGLAQRGTQIFRPKYKLRSCVLKTTAAFTKENKNIKDLIQKLLKEYQPSQAKISDPSDTNENGGSETKTISLQDFITELKKQVEAQSNTDKRQALQNIQTSLETMNTRYTALNDSVQKLEPLWDDNVASEANQIVESWNQFSDAQLELASTKTNNDQDIFDRAENIVNEYIKRYETDLSSCTKDLEQEVQKFKSSAQKAIESYQPAINELIEKGKACIASEDSADAAKKCISDSTSSSNALVSAADALKELAEKGTQILQPKFKERECVSKTLAAFQEENNSIKDDIQTLVKEYEAAHAGN